VKRFIPVALLGAIGLAAIAATCTVQNVSLTKIGDHDVFAGELHNDSGVDILNHKIQVSFLNNNLAVLEIRTVNGCLRSLQDGKVNFFSVSSTQDADQTSIGLARMANLQEDPAFKVGNVAQGNISFSNVTAIRTGTSLTVTGTLKNDDGDPLNSPAVCAVVYDEDGRVVIVGRDTLANLAVNASGAFSVTLAVPDNSDLVDTVDLWADGLEDSVPTAPESSLNHAVTVQATSTASPTPTATSTPVPTETP
jgi:hypothetical protein